jgi:hypothetical protein
MSSSARDLGLFMTGTLVGSGVLFAILKRRSRRVIAGPPEKLPDFAKSLEEDSSLHRIRLREWEDLEWRSSAGWHGRDFCHNKHGTAVRVLSYYYDDALEVLTGVVWFGPDAESHRGLCHGGAMSSLMDDFCGHVAFISSDAPWSGATVQVNVTLKKPVPIGSVLRIVGKVYKRDRRKAFVEAVLDDGGASIENISGEPVAYAALEGLSIDGVKMSQYDDDISERKWEVDVCKEGRLHRRDSGWKIT